MSTSPFNYQIIGADKAEEFNGRILIADEQGLGKSLEALLYAHRHPELRPLIIVCPAGLKLNWERECKIHFNMRAEVLYGTRPPKKGLVTKRKILIINYEILGPSKFGPGWLNYLLALEPKIIVMDECQFVCNRSAKRSKALKILCQATPHIIGLSGTPLTNKHSELWHPVHLIRPDLFPSFHKFAQTYCPPKVTPWGISHSTSINGKQLHRLLSESVMIRRLKVDVLADLPKKMRNTVPLPLERPKEYKEASEDFIKWLVKYKPGKIPRAQRAVRLTQMGYLKRLAAHLKLKSVIEWVDNFLVDSEEKIILFAVHRKIIAKLHSKYAKNSVIVDGSVTGLKRQRAIDQFLKNSKTRILIGNIKAAGTGWSAKGISTVAFCELAWTPGEHVQAEDRIHGVGRGKADLPASVYYLVAADTIESHLLKVIQKKQKVLTTVLDGRGRGDKLNIFDSLHKALLKGVSDE